MNIEDLTLKQIKEINALNITNNTIRSDHPYEIGKNYTVRTVTMIFTGRLVSVFQNEIVLVDAAWIGQTERYADFVKDGAHIECEPYPDNLQVIIGRGGIIDACVLNADLPRKQK